MTLSLTKKVPNSRLDMHCSEEDLAMKSSRFFILVLALYFSLGARPTLAAADEYDDSQSNPLRIVAYLMYPAAFLVEWTVFRPFHWIVSATPPQEAFFGHTPHPPVLADPQSDNNYGIGRRVPTREAKLETRMPTAEAVPGNVKIVEVPVEKIIVKEVPTVVEVPRIVEVPRVVEVEKLIFPSLAFLSGSVELTELGKGQIGLAAARLREKSGLTIVVESPADGSETDRSNQQLAVLRAQTLMRELAGLGIERSRMSAADTDFNRPTINHDTALAQAMNGRVEFQVRAP